ncbi:MAG TPA: DUF4127 family protein, partial [Blastocatellia bacterium]|nr:DUF4127 family protein [Blastocatellia bacterium]
RVFFRRLSDRADRAARATTAHLEFLLNRYANDYLYHTIVRPKVNTEIKSSAENSVNELPPELYSQVSKRVEAELKPLMEGFFTEHFQGRAHSLAFYHGIGRSVKINGLSDLHITLPWPRTFEVRIDYRFDFELK